MSIISLRVVMKHIFFSSPSLHNAKDCLLVFSSFISSYWTINISPFKNNIFINQIFGKPPPCMNGYWICVPSSPQEKYLMQAIQICRSVCCAQFLGWNVVLPNLCSTVKEMCTLRIVQCTTWYTTAEMLSCMNFIC